ncbi:hypothetical protein GT037_004343 [Alternaria burnsii]|uniref:Uncharacterized protein n=1 Tax=Alternaria burnsii TaxID=1187904 RepID=A0A8H7EIY9_9PLEO|nr:uncharacterized protein GT037_004343 [Alternaria burnsii]KAF7677484.1 hypothetical protein GT037_004343 [Alternaria burnsii]CAI9627321.1 unnamed protein product [Alternaria burnsii]
MFAKLSTSLIATLIISTTLAAPTQTHCRCEIVNDIPSSPAPASAAYTPSAAHWSPANTLPSPVAAINVCASLGSKLEKLQHTEPEIYDSYMRGAVKDAQKPLPTSVLMSNPEMEEDDDAQSTSSRPQGRILCYQEVRSSPTEFHSSFVGLWALQIIVVSAVLACVAEGVHLGKRWMENKSAPEPTCQKHSRLRLSGAEKRLLAIPTGPQQADLVCSPGAEKKLRAYETTRYFVTQASSGRREFIAYDDDSDDEANRPVM